MKRRLIELAKSILILLLAVAVVVLTMLAAYQGRLMDAPVVSAVAGALGLVSAEPAYSAPESTTYEAARPDTLVVTTAEGHSSITRSFSEIDTAFDVLGRYLGAALEAAETAESTTESVWRAALSGPGVYFHYWGAVPIGALADWFRMELGFQDLEEVQTGQLLLSITEENTVTLLFCSEDGYWQCPTALDAADLTVQLELYRPDGSIFAFESDQSALSRLAPESVLNLTAAPVLRSATAANPVEQNTSFVKDVATALGFNPYDDTGYTAGDGSSIFSESDCRLSVSADGTVRFTMLSLAEASARFSAASEEAPALIEEARILLENLTQGSLGDAKLYLTGFSRSGSTATVTFTYFLDGVPVQQSAGTAATVTFSGSSLLSLTLRARTYTLTDTTVSLLPAAQATALVSAGSYLTVEYADTGGDSLSCGWVAE